MGVNEFMRQLERDDVTLYNLLFDEAYDSMREKVDDLRNVVGHEDLGKLLTCPSNGKLSSNGMTPAQFLHEAGMLYVDRTAQIYKHLLGKLDYKK